MPSGWLPRARRHGAGTGGVAVDRQAERAVQHTGVHRADALCNAQEGADAIAPIAVYGPMPPTPTLTND